MTRLALAALLILVACDDDDDDFIDDTDVVDTDDGDTDDGDTDEPSVARFVPEVASSGGLIYVLGENLLPPSGDLDDLEVSLVDDDGNLILLLEVLEAEDGQIVVRVPADAHLQVTDGATVAVKHTGGTALSTDRVFIVESTGLGDGTEEPGEGLFGRVYALQPDTSALPDLLGEDPCADPAVDDTNFRCPFTTILLPRLDIPSRSFETGFPGLGQDLVEWFAIDFAADLDLPRAGTYTFELCSDDGSALYLDRGDGLERVVDNDGQHSFRCETADVELSSGPIPLRVLYFQGPRTSIGLTLSWRTPDSTTLEIVPNDAYQLDLSVD